jgi:hypothetical protein
MRHGGCGQLPLWAKFGFRGDSEEDVGLLAFLYSAHQVDKIGY